MSVKVFPDEINFESVDWLKEISHPPKQIAHPPVCVGLIQSAEGTNRTKRLRKGEFSHSAYLWAGTSVFSCLLTQAQTKAYTICYPASRNFGLTLELNHQFSWVHSLLTADLELLFLFGVFLFVCLFCLFVFWPRSMWDLSSPTRDQNHAPCSRSTES